MGRQRIEVEVTSFVRCKHCGEMVELDAFKEHLAKQHQKYIGTWIKVKYFFINMFKR